MLLYDHKFGELGDDKPFLDKLFGEDPSFKLGSYKEYDHPGIPISYEETSLIELFNSLFD